MSYKICSRCQFRIPGRKNICTTCGGKAFAEIAFGSPAKDSDVARGYTGDLGSSALRARPAVRASERLQFAPPAVKPGASLEFASRQSFISAPAFSVDPRNPQPAVSGPVVQGFQLEPPLAVARSNNILREKFCYEDKLAQSWLQEKWSQFKRALHFN